MKRLLLLITICISSVSFGQVPNYVPTNGLVGWWGFNGNANDESGNGNNGVNNGATLTTDRFGNADAAYYFSSSGCATRIDADVNTTSINGGITVCLWLSREGNGCAGPRVFEAWPGANDIGHLVLSWDNSLNYPQSWSHNLGVGSYDVNMQGATDIDDNEWVFFVYTNDGLTAKYFQNDSLIHEMPCPTGSQVLLATDLAIGRMNHPANDAFNGKIDDIGIWNRALTECEIKDLYEGSLGNCCVPDPITSQPTDITVPLNGSGMFSTATSITSPSYQWQMDDGTGYRGFNQRRTIQWSGYRHVLTSQSNVTILVRIISYIQMYCYCRKSNVKQISTDASED